MGDFECPIPKLNEGEELPAAIELVESALRSNENLTEESQRRLLDLYSSWCTFACNHIKDENIGVLVNLIDVAQKKFMWFEAGQLPCHEDLRYLNDADGARLLVEKVSSLSLNKEDNNYNLKLELQRRASVVLQMAMAMLEKRFKELLSKSKQASELPEYLLPEDSGEPSVRLDSVGRVPEVILQFFEVDVISELNRIATLMFNSKCGQQCAQAYTSMREKDFDSFKNALKVVNTKEVWRMSSNCSRAKIKRWTRVVEIFVQVFLASELILCEQIFKDLDEMAHVCFVEASKVQMLQLLAFGDDIPVHPHQRESFLCVLDAYQELSPLLPRIVAFYMGEPGSFITMKVHELLRRFGDSVKAAFTEFVNVVDSDNSTLPVLEGDIHPLSQDVINFLKKLTDYVETLNSLLKNHEEGSDPAPFSLEERKELPHVAHHFISIVAALERCLDAKSKSYKDAALQNLFMMSNIHYVVKKVEGCDLELVFGKTWIKEHQRKFNQCAWNYDITSWVPVLNQLNDEGLESPSSSSTSTALLKLRLKRFFTAFEQIYEAQTGWVVPDDKLRNKLSTLISVKLILAYRTFKGKYASHLDDRFIKYDVEDLEKYLLDLFGGTPKSL